jgi:serine-type D-Ala-D-Ala carboxypeptidase/endopeptidase (penicillin-binding protein 4)
MLRTVATTAALASVISGLGLAGVSLFRDPSVTLNETNIAGRTPVFSIRRAPALLVDNIAAASLAGTVIATLEKPEMIGVDERSCLLAELVSPAVIGRPIIAREKNRPVIPASTLKVFTANSALSVLDPNERFRTTVRATVKPLSGTLTGDLWIVGGGDPLLESSAYSRTRKHAAEVTTSLDKLADDVIAAGVQRITGRIVGDDRLFDDIRILPTWKKSYVTQGEVGPMGGLIIDDNFTQLDTRNRPIAATDVPTNAAQAFQRLLVARGVIVEGEAASAPRTSPEAATAAPHVIATIDSIPVSAIVAEMLSESDNMTAEALVKHIGLRTSGSGSTESGIAAIGRSLALTGSPESSRQSVRMVDGSGLDRSDRASCAALVDMLRVNPNGPLIQGFAVMGESGTLKTRLKGTPAAGKVKAKTGTLNGVSALTGLAETSDGRTVRFAMVLNGLTSTGYGVSLGNEFAEALVGFGSGISPELLAPKA